ncbi:MAG: hypothetical protein JWM09_1348 [Francisellaceae bacterium]|nr:hypothetical protein [Francisellaceae bacterium]
MNIKNGIDKLIRKFFIGIFILPSLINTCSAENNLSIASGYGTSRIIPLKIGYAKSWDKKWYRDCSWLVGGYWEVSAYNLKSYTKKSKHIDNNKSLQAFTGAGVVRFEKTNPIKDLFPYVDIGFGATYLSKKEIGGRHLGIHFQFEDRLGIGFRFGKHKQFDLSYRAVHFSNAYIGDPNHGVNLQLIVLGYWF